jgi:predicted Zn-dependent peptidase
MEKKKTASNGIDIFYYKQPNTHSICISLYVKSGVLYEKKNFGITHFLEHIHFRRLGNKNQKELYYQLESIGGYFGACTAKEFVQFYFTSSPKYFAELASIASDLLGEVEANSKEFSAEKRIILSEIREDNQGNDVDFLANKFIWKDTNLENPVLGSISSVKGITLEDLKAEKEKTFTKNNIFFYVTGNFGENDIDTLAKEVERYNLDSRSDKENDNMAKVPDNFMRRDAFVKLSNRKFFMHDVKLSFDVDFSRISRIEMIYLDSILTDGLCSLIRADLIEKKGLVYSFSSTIEEYSNIGVYSFSFEVYKSKLYEAVKSFVEVFKAAKQEISEKDMQATRVFKTDNQMGLLDDPEGLNWQFAYQNHILNNEYKDITSLAEGYRKIKKDRLVEIANEIFKKDNAIIVSIGNKKGLKEEKLRDILLELD